MGSGVIAIQNGIIMTAAHAIKKPDAEVTVFIPDGRRLKAKNLGLHYGKEQPW